MILDAHQVRDAIVELFGNATNPELVEEGGRIHGFVVSPAFSNKPAADRRSLLWDGLRGRFGEQSKDIGIIFCYSPEEYVEMSA